jgi:hypothetical protein
MGHRPSAVYQSTEFADPAIDSVQNRSSLRRASGNLLEVDIDQFGQRALFYGGIPLYVDDFISDTQMQGSSGSVCSSVYGAKFGQGVGALGLEHGRMQIEKVGELET